MHRRLPLLDGIGLQPGGRPPLIAVADGRSYELVRRETVADLLARDCGRPSHPARRRMSSGWTAVAARTLSGAASVRVTAVYAVVLIAISENLAALGPRARGLIVSDLSTNLHNLAHGQLGTLVGSAFVSDGGDIYVWLPGLVCLLALGELIWRSSGLLTTFAVGHIGATLLVALWLVAAVEAQWLPASVTRATEWGSATVRCVFWAR